MQNRRRGSTRNQRTHLPTIAPKDEPTVSPSSGTQPAPTTGALGADIPRTRLPPRSRTGCWTCRLRKVKCDEQRPTCDQCARLQHKCDYSPRLSFRDDTPRVVERMHEVLKSGSPVWDPQSHYELSDQDTRVGDYLPPFTTLTNDEDRERKAESSLPGTYHVVVNQYSFAGLPEYSGGGVATEIGPEDWEKYSLARRPSVEEDRASSMDVAEESHVVILRRFEEPGRRTSLRSQTRSSNSSVSPMQFAGINPLPLHSVSTSTEAARRSSFVDDAGQSRGDLRLTEYYRRFISCRIIHVLHSGLPERTGDGRTSGEDAFEKQARDFPPLFHAMKALSALSLAFKENSQNLDALQHYQQALPLLQTSLRSARDISSEGALFTHFFLLLYEITAAEQWGSNMWLEHLNHLLRIILRRRDDFGREQHFLLIWFVCIIDTYALLSSCGEGDFVGTIIQNDLLPISKQEQSSGGFRTLGSFHWEEEDTFPSVLHFNQQIVILASQLGQLARTFRGEKDQQFFVQRSGQPLAQIDMQNRKRQVIQIQEAFRSTWRSAMPRSVASDWLRDSLNLPLRVQAVIQHAYALHYACLIYSHTSMWPSQRDDIEIPGDMEIARSVAAILELTQSLLQSQRLELRFIVFPLFMAGFATASDEEKILALDFMKALEHESLGRNTTRIRSLLQVVYERQNDTLMRIGHARNVDWISIMAEQGLQVVNFGL